jgi:hypothetical protein
MDSLTNCTDFDSHTDKPSTSHSKWNVEKNYAPCLIPSGPSDARDLHKSRSDKTSATFAQKIAQRSALQAQANQAQPGRVINAEKQAKRDAYQTRVAERTPRYIIYDPPPVNISPLLNFTIGEHTPAEIESRVFTYNKKRHCPHGNRFNIVTRHYHVYADKSPSLLTWVELSCDCTSVVRSRETFDRPCGNCTATTTYILKDPVVPEACYCRMCKFTWYHTIGWGRIKPTHLSVALSPEKRQQRKDLYKTFDWNSLHIPIVEEESGLFDGISTAIKSFLGHISTLCTSVKSFLSDQVSRLTTYVVSSAASNIFLGVWDLLAELVESVIKTLEKRPLSFLIHFWHLLHTESAMERVLILTAVLTECGLHALWNRIADQLKCHNLMIGSWAGISNTVHQLKRERRERLDKRLLEVDNNSESETFSVEHESGDSFLSTLFGFTHWLPRTSAVLNHLKDFNTIMSSWKNLHELVNNLLTYLPNWFTKLFTITDPRKRLGVEAKTPGNAVYDMLQAYLNLLKGENCASPAAYETFKVCYRACEHYVNEEYPPNEQVLRMVKHYLTSANAIMQPGTHGSKPIPFVVTLFGEPGTGKSTSWPLLFSGIVPGNMREIWAKSYTRNPTSSFFDGYVPEKHKIFVYDDFGSQVDDESAGEIMSIVSSADYLPPYASLNDPNVGVKGTSFASPIVILNSNFKTFTQCKQIADKTALHRRLGIIITWDQRINLASPLSHKFKVERATVKGTVEDIKNTDGTNFFNFREIQELLKQEYVRHFSLQTAITDAFDKLLAPTKVENFMQHYYDVATAQQTIDTTPIVYTLEPMSDHFLNTHTNPPTSNITVFTDLPTTSKITVEPQAGFLLSGFGFFSLLTATYKLADWIDEKYKAVGDVLMIAAGAFAAVATAGYFFFGRPKAESESGENAVARAPAKVPFVRAVAQDGFDDDANISRTLQNHVCIVDEIGKFTNALFLRGRQMLINKHFLRSLDQTLTVHTHRSLDTAVFEFPLSSCKRVDIPNVDLTVLECPTQVTPFADILKGKITDVPFTKSTSGYVSRRQPNMSLIMHATRIQAARREIHVRDPITGIQVPTFSDISYELRHQRGDCGNLIFSTVDGCSKIVGFHSFGDLSNPTHSFGIMLNKTELVKACAQFGPAYPRDDAFIHEGEVEFEDGVGMCNKNMFVTMSQKHVPSPGKTSLLPSEVFDQINKHVTAPALLRLTKEHDPLMQDLTKYSPSVKQYNTNHVEMAVDSIISELMPHVDNNLDMRRELTLDEALNGIPGEVESVDTTTSSGYPFSLNNDTRGPKRLVLTGEPGKLNLGLAATLEYRRWYKLLEKGIVPNDPFMVTLKDERRKLEKVRLGQTRVFCAGGLIPFLMNKQLFGGFSAFFKRTRGKTFSTLGMDRGSLEWDNMIRRELEVGPHALDGDHKGWDGRAKSAAMIALSRVFDAFYGNTDERRKILIMHAVFCLLRITWTHPQDFKLLYTIIIETTGAMPSGWYMTFTLNCLLNALMTRIAWLSLVAAPCNDLYYFRKYTRDKYAGDDSRMAVAEAFLEAFNNKTLQEFFARYDQIYTPATKDGELVPYKRVIDCSFLKQTTGRLFDRYVPLFELDACLETTNWIRKCDDHMEATENNCNDVLRNLFFYGRDTFERYRHLMQRAAPWANLISFDPIADSFLNIGKVPDPTGAFTYSKSARRDPLSFYKGIESLIATRVEAAKLGTNSKGSSDEQS